VLNAIENTSAQSIIAARRQSAFRMDRVRQNRIEGSISCLTNGYLVFQMPFDDGWQVTVNEVPVAAQRVDIGLLGVPLTIGEHKVTLRYLPPFLRIGAAISLLSVLLLIIGRWRWPRMAPLEAKSS
jgi:uncharacterized membrane protein YfhO